MAKSDYFWAISIISSLIKEIGWGTICTATIAGVDPKNLVGLKLMEQDLYHPGVEYVHPMYKRVQLYYGNFLQLVL